MKKLLLAAAIFLGLCGAAEAQCNGVFTPGQVCGNNTNANRTPFPISALTSFFQVPTTTISGDIITWGSTTSGYLSDQQTILTSQSITLGGITQAVSGFTFTGPVSSYTLDILSNYLYQGNIIGFPTVATSLVYPSGSFNFSGNNSHSGSETFTGPLSANIVTLSQAMSVAMGGTGTTGFGQNAIPLTRGATAFSEVDQGTFGQCLGALQGGGGLTPGYASGCRVLIGTFALTTSSNTFSVSSIFSNYNDYEIVIENFAITGGAGSQQPALQIEANGAFQTSAYLASNIIYLAATATGSSATNGIILTSASQTVDSPGWSGKLQVLNPSATTSGHTFIGQGAFYNGTNSVGVNASGIWNYPAAVTGFRLITGAGSWFPTSGALVKVYGVQ